MTNKSQDEIGKPLLCGWDKPQHTKGRIYLFSHTHTHKTRIKKTIKIKNLKNSMEKTKKGGKKKLAKKQQR